MRSKVDLEAATRKRVRDVFRHAGFVGWRNEGVVRGELEEIADEARHHSEAGRAERALEILVAAASEIVAHFDQIDDSNGVISGEVVQWLGELPLHIEPGLDAGRRGHFLQSLLDIADADYGFDHQGGQALALLAGNDRFLTASIERWAADRRAASRKRWGYDDRAAARVLLDLYAEQERWQEYLALAVEVGEWKRYAHVGLRRGLDPLGVAERVRSGARVPDALEVGWLLLGAGHPDGADLLFSAVLAHAPGSEEAHRGKAEVSLVRGRADEGERHLLQAVGTGRGSSAYSRLRELLAGSGRWEQARRKAHEALRSSGDLVTLVRALLEEGEPVSAAREALALDPTWAYRTMREAARAVEEADPTLAVNLYRRLAEGCIEGRNRQLYRIAAGYLAKAREVLSRSERVEEWVSLVAQVREANRRRPALLEELVARGL